MTYTTDKLNRLAEDHMRAKIEYDRAVQIYTNSHMDDDRVKSYQEVQRKLVLVEAKLRLLRSHSEMMIGDAVAMLEKMAVDPVVFNGEYDG